MSRDVELWTFLARHPLTRAAGGGWVPLDAYWDDLRNQDYDHAQPPVVQSTDEDPLFGRGRG